MHLKSYISRRKERHIWSHYLWRWCRKTKKCGSFRWYALTPYINKNHRKWKVTPSLKSYIVICIVHKAFIERNEFYRYPKCLLFTRVYSRITCLILQPKNFMALFISCVARHFWAHSKRYLLKADLLGVRIYPSNFLSPLNNQKTVFSFKNAHILRDLSFTVGRQHPRLILSLGRQCNTIPSTAEGKIYLPNNTYSSFAPFAFIQPQETTGDVSIENKSTPR